MASLLPRVRTWRGYRRVFGRPRVWRRAVLAICARHGIRTRRLGGVYPGTCVVFLAGRRRLVKLYSPLSADDCPVEVSALSAARRAGLRVPRVVARGVLHDGGPAPDAWPYLVLEPVPGRPVRDVMARMPARSRLAIATAAGRFLRRFHAAAPRGCPGWATVRPGELAARALAAYRESGAFAPGLLRDLGRRVPGLLRPAGPRCFVHGDFNEDHVLVARRRGQWRFVGVIDFSDARVGDAAYEWMPVWLGLLGRDPDLLRAFLRGFAPGTRVTDAWRDRATAFTLVHAFGPPSVAAVLRRDRVRRRCLDWAGLRDRLWPPAAAR